MKCLLCNFQLNDQNDLRNHNINFHRVDSKNEFFNNIFAEDKNVFYKKRCLSCQEYLPPSRFNIYHNFLKYYNDDETVEITFQEHSDSYDFFNSEKLVDKLLLSVKGEIFCSNTDFYIRCGFSLENMQVRLTDDVPLTNSRYWSTEPIQIKSFNDFVSQLQKIIFEKGK